jgi:hypothetical protein
MHATALYQQEVTTLGQPLEVLKTQMAANRQQTMLQAFNTVLSRGGIKGFYQGLIPWAWIEASTKGAVLLFASGEIETMAKEKFGLGGAGAGLLGGMGGGIAQAYATMGKPRSVDFLVSVGLLIRTSVIFLPLLLLSIER